MNHKLELSTPKLYDRGSIEFFSEYSKQVPAHEVLTQNLSIPHQPFEYNPSSPTPGDPYALRIGRAAGALELDSPFGIGYKSAGQFFMEGMLATNAAAIEIDDKYLEPIADEITAQHDHRVESNDITMQAFKSTLSHVDSIDKSSAELIMRVRAGVGSVDEPARLIAAQPTIGGLEAMKATRPFMKDELRYADVMFLRDLRLASMQENTPIRNLQIFNDSPYRVSVINENNIIVMKRLQASMNVGRRSLEVVSRESYIGVPENEVLRNVSPDLRKIGKAVVNLLPIDITKYYRISKTVS